MKRRLLARELDPFLALVNSVSATPPRLVSLGSLLLEVCGLYDYRSQGPDELGVSEGTRIELTSGPSGGQNYGDGWWEGQLQRTPASSRVILI